MARRIPASMLALLVGFALVSASFAQDAKKDVKKDTKPAVTDTKAQTKKEPAKDAKKPAGPRTMKFVACTQPGCGLWAKSYSGRELRVLMKRHMKKYHKTDLTLAQLKAMVKKHEGK